MADETVSSTDSNGIDWLREIEDIPSNVSDRLGKEVLRRWNGAVLWQSTERVNGKGLRDVLRECWEQQNGVLSCSDQQIADALGVNAIVNLTALKTGIANAYLSDALISSTLTLPWVIMATPRPSISPESREMLLTVLKQGFFENRFQDGMQMVDFIRRGKQLLLRHEKEEADKAANEMMSLLEDQCAEGGFNRALSDFLHYFTVYPYSIFTGPYITRSPRLTWGRNKPRVQTEVLPVFRSISPFDFAYSPDSPDTQRGTCVFTRTLWTRKELLDAGKLSSYISENVLDVLKKADTNDEFNLNWLTREPNSEKRDLALWASNVAPIEILTHYGIMSGRELAEYGFHSLDRSEFYNCEISMAGYKVLQVKVNSDPHMQTRPIYTSSFYRTGGDRIAGDGIAQRIRDVERAYHSCLIYLMRNAANASAPMCEADYRRLMKYMKDTDLGTIVPGTMYLSDSDPSGGSNPALRFFNIPSNLPAYSQLLEMFIQLADRVTNIPAALHGEAVGSGAMRTFRGMSLLQGNATRALHAAVGNIDNNVFAPLGELMYNINMLYASDSSVKGDVQIVTKGAEGLLQKETEKQNAMEMLQVIGAVGGSLSGAVNLTPVVGWAVKKLFGAMNIPDDVLEQMNAPVQGAAPQTGNGQSAGQGNGMMPNSNPAPDSPAGAGVAQDTGGHVEAY